MTAWWRPEDRKRDSRTLEETEYLTREDCFAAYCPAG